MQVLQDLDSMVVGHGGWPACPADSMVRLRDWDPPQGQVDGYHSPHSFIRHPGHRAISACVKNCTSLYALKDSFRKAKVSGGGSLLGDAMARYCVTCAVPSVMPVTMIVAPTLFFRRVAVGMGSLPSLDTPSDSSTNAFVWTDDDSGGA